ncbi:MAG: class I SAM-dependent methyltransferase [Chloroflexota bacterium]|nr:class I SAM-dependent methyltransferase [Chloroflexota bacterium]
MTEITAMQDHTFEAFAGHDFYRRVNEHLVDTTLQVRDAAQVPIQRALDLACGTGAVTQLLVDRLRRIREPVEVIAVDPSESALEKARRLVGTAARFVRGTAQAFSNVVSGVDVVVFCNAIHLLQDKDHVLAEVHKSLNLEGVLGFNTAFYNGCYAPGTERFYKLWMLRALQLLKQENGLRPDRSKVEAMNWLTPDDYRSLLERQGFEIQRMDTEQALMSCESWQDISHYSEFAEGALPGVPLEVAIPVLQRSVEQAYHELGITELPRNWLQVVARAV